MCAIKGPPGAEKYAYTSDRRQMSGRRILELATGHRAQSIGVESARLPMSKAQRSLIIMDTKHIGIAFAHRDGPGIVPCGRTLPKYLLYLALPEYLICKALGLIDLQRILVRIPNGLSSGHSGM
jgi:hypothetical protein